VKTKSVLVALDAAGVKVAAIIEDAVRRDRALDTYERVLQKSFDDLIATKEQENRELENEINERIRDLRERIATNRNEIDNEQQQLLAWRTSKRAEEQRIAGAVNYFVSENPITTGNAPASDNGGSTNVR
jgi:exonuclease VII large subunit